MSNEAAFDQAGADIFGQLGVDATYIGYDAANVPGVKVNLEKKQPIIGENDYEPRLDVRVNYLWVRIEAIGQSPGLGDTFIITDTSSAENGNTFKVDRIERDDGRFSFMYVTKVH